MTEHEGLAALQDAGLGFIVRTTVHEGPEVQYSGRTYMQLELYIA